MLKEDKPTRKELREIVDKFKFSRMEPRSELDLSKREENIFYYLIKKYLMGKYGEGKE